MEKLMTIPVFGITDEKGNSVAVKSADGATVNHVFLQREVGGCWGSRHPNNVAELFEMVLRCDTAEPLPSLQVAAQLVEAFEAQAKEAGTVEGVGKLQVSDVPLGMIWKDLAKPGDGPEAGALKGATAEGGEQVVVQLRLMADPVDLAIAKNVSATISAADEGDSAADKEAKLARAERAAARLESAWGVVPVFTMAGMQIRVKNQTTGEPVELRPWYVSVGARSTTMGPLIEGPRHGSCSFERLDLSSFTRSAWQPPAGSSASRAVLIR